MQTYQINGSIISKLEWSGDHTQNWTPDSKENSRGFIYQPGVSENKFSEKGDLTIYFTDPDREAEIFKDISAKDWKVMCRKEKQSDLQRVIPGFILQKD